MLNLSQAHKYAYKWLSFKNMYLCIYTVSACIEDINLYTRNNHYDVQIMSNNKIIFYKILNINIKEDIKEENRGYAVPYLNIIFMHFKFRTI